MRHPSSLHFNYELLVSCANIVKLEKPFLYEPAHRASATKRPNEHVKFHVFSQ